MACFLVPVAEAIVTTIVEKALKSTEKKAAVKLNSADGTALEVSKPRFLPNLVGSTSCFGAAPLS